MNPSPVFIYCPICKKVQKQKPRSQMRRTHLASCLAEVKRFELLRRQNRPTGFRIRTLQPLGYTSMYWKSVARFTTCYSLFSKNCVHPMSVLCFWGLFQKPETPCSTMNYRFYRTFFSSHPGWNHSNAAAKISAFIMPQIPGSDKGVFHSRKNIFSDPFVFRCRRQHSPLFAAKLRRQKFMVTNVQKSCIIKLLFSASAGYFLGFVHIHTFQSRSHPAWTNDFP